MTLAASRPRAMRRSPWDRYRAPMRNAQHAGGLDLGDAVQWQPASSASRTNWCPAEPQPYGSEADLTEIAPRSPSPAFSITRRPNRAALSFMLSPRTIGWSSSDLDLGSRTDPDRRSAKGSCHKAAS